MPPQVPKEKLQSFQNALGNEGYLPRESFDSKGKPLQQAIFPDATGTPNPATNQAIFETIMFAQTTALYRENFGEPTGRYDANVQKVFDAMVKPDANGTPYMTPELAGSFRQAAQEGWLSEVYKPPGGNELQAKIKKFNQELDQNAPGERARLQQLKSFDGSGTPQRGSELQGQPRGQKYAGVMPRSDLATGGGPMEQTQQTASVATAQEVRSKAVPKLPGVPV